MDVLSDPANPVVNECSEEDLSLYLSLFGAFELYSVKVLSGGYDLCEIFLKPNYPMRLPPDSIYKAPEREPESEPCQKMQKVAKKFLRLHGPKYHLTCDPQLFYFCTNSLPLDCKEFVADWDLSCYGEKTVRTKKVRCSISDEVKFCYEWISHPARANFIFSFMAEDDSTQQTIQNLKGCITVSSSCRKGTTRTLALFDDDDVISGEKLRLLRSHAAFHAGEDYNVICDLSFLVDGTPKEIKTTRAFPSPYGNPSVKTEEELSKAKLDPKLHDEYFIGDGHPKLQINVFWLTILADICL